MMGMSRDEAIAIIRKEYLCVDRDCDIEKKCEKCDLVMPSKEPILEAYKTAIKALEQEPGDVPDTNVGDMISRQAVLDALHARFGDDFVEGKWWSSTHVLAAIESVPGVSQEPKVGHWIFKKDMIYCSECAECFDVINYNDFNRCPNCGARMVEQEESEVQE